MASLQSAASKLKRKVTAEQDEVVLETGEGSSSAGKVSKRRKDRVLILSSRGVTMRMRHLQTDLALLLPQSKRDAKLDSKSSLHLINELADLHSCNNTLYFESRRHQDLYMWLSKTPNGPSVKFEVKNSHTMDEIKMSGNCLKGSRAIVTFDGGWDKAPEYKLMRELLMQTFSTAPSSRKIKPFIDHIITFSLLDGKVWFRNYQIIQKDPTTAATNDRKAAPEMTLVEIGPRFALTPIKIFEGSFSGATVWSNDKFITPTALRSAAKRTAGTKYKDRKIDEEDKKARRAGQKIKEDELEVGKVFA